MHAARMRSTPAGPAGRLHARVSACVVASLLVLSAATWGCGGEGGGFADNGGMSGTGVSSGPVSGFGSVFVTDIEWDLGGATIEIDGKPGTEAELRLGMVVRVQGSAVSGAVTGTATSLVADDSIEGPLDADPVAVGADRIDFEIFGVALHALRSATTFDDGASFDNLAGGDVVEVYGLPDDTGSILATRVELRAGSTEAELKGNVSGLMTSVDEFMLGSITIVYDESTTVFRSGLTDESDLSNGQLVEVEGTLVAPLRIDAKVIELEGDPFGVEDADEAKLRGFVVNLSGSQFSVSGVPVDASGATYDPPTLNLVNGDYVEIEGRLSSGTLVAKKVELERLDDRDGDSVEIEAELPIGGKNAFGPNTLRMVDPVSGIQVQVNGATRFDDNRDGVPGFSFGDIADGDWLEIRGVAVDAANGIVVATRIERDGIEDKVILQGPVTALDRIAQTLSILGQPITKAPGIDYEDVDGSSLTATAFFQTVDLDDVVEATDESAASLDTLGSVDELEIEAFDP